MGTLFRISLIVALLWAPFCPMAMAQSMKEGMSDMPLPASGISVEQGMQACCVAPRNHVPDFALPAAPGSLTLSGPCIIVDASTCPALPAFSLAHDEDIRGPPSSVDHHCSIKRE